MKYASWNINSMKVRLDHIKAWLQEQPVDVLGLQELKMISEVFPFGELADIGYEAWANGQPTYNGVALLIRSEWLDQVDEESLITELPNFDDLQRRVIALTINNTRVINVYVPNGQSLESEKFVYKLNWFKALHAWLAEELTQHEQLIIMGDFNIAPADADVYDPTQWQNQVLCSEPERQAYKALLNLGLTDCFRIDPKPPEQFSWWDYRGGGFARNHGLRIDLILASAALASQHQGSGIDVTPRGWERPSDHTPVWSEFK